MMRTSFCSFFGYIAQPPVQLLLYVGNYSTSSPGLTMTPKEEEEADSNSETDDLEAGRSSEKAAKDKEEELTAEADRFDESNASPPSLSYSSWWSQWVTLWSQERLMATVSGCCSSCAVLAIRLVLDHEPTAYLIHSIVVFLDMVLIHVFTKTVWLSVAGECVTILSFLAFHYTKETIYELLETTLLAALCSFHLIGARRKTKQEKNELEDDINKMRHRGNVLLRNIHQVQQRLAKEESNNGSTNNTDKGTTSSTAKDHQTDEAEDGPESELSRELLHVGTRDCSFSSKLQQWFVPLEMEEYQLRVRWFGNTFFEYFLDGSAGVMYTSFLGLIIDEIISYGHSKQY
jgi:hypothetical protein